MSATKIGSGSAAGNSLAFRALARILSRRYIWIVGSLIVCTFLGVLRYKFQKPIYDATSTIELNKSSGGSLDLDLGSVFSQQLSAGGESLLTDLQTETAILRSDALGLSVIENLNLVEEPPFAVPLDSRKGQDPEQGLPLENAPRTRSRLLRIFHEQLRVEPVRGTRLIRVTYESHDPKQAVRIANQIIDSYKNQYLRSHYDATTEASAWLTRQLSDLKSNVEDSEKKLTVFEKENGILNLNGVSSGSQGGEGQVHSVVIQKLDVVNAELTAAEANRIEKEAIYRLTQTSNPDVILGLQNDPLATKNGSTVFEGGGLGNLQAMRAQESQVKIELTEASATYGANNRHLKEIQTQLAAIDDQVRQQVQQITKRAEGDFELAQQTEAGIRKQFNQQQTAAGELNEKAVEFAVLSQEAYSRKKLYEDLYTRLQEANVSAGIKATNITVVDPARTQPEPVRPKFLNSSALGGFLGLILGLVLAVIVDTFDRTVVGTAEMEELSGLPEIGLVPDFEESSRTYGTRRATGEPASTLNPNIPSQIWMLHRPESAAAEAVRALRTSIMLSRAGGGPKVLLVTSCRPGEGKTTLTTNLAVSFAQHNKRVILVEADMRRPRLKQVTGVSNEVGLSSVLSGARSLDEAVQRSIHVPTLDILSAGPRPPMPSEMLGSSSFDDLLEELRGRYDMILIDSPPALLVTDAVTISPKADAVMWVAYGGVVTRQELMRASELIKRNHMPAIGIVANRITKKLGSYGYGYGYGYAYSGYNSYYGDKPSDNA